MVRKGPCGELPHLRGQRYIVNELGPKTHDVSRHAEFGDDAILRHPELPPKYEPVQGSRFPPYVKAGDISEIRKYVSDQYHLFIHGQPSAVIDSQPAYDAYRVTVVLGKFGVNKVQVFFHNNVVKSVYPIEANGTNRIISADGDNVRQVGPRGRTIR